VRNCLSTAYRLFGLGVKRRQPPLPVFIVCIDYVILHLSCELSQFKLTLRSCSRDNVKLIK
jgi:hypothetical protein